MERGRQPHVIRTWAVDRIRQHGPVGPVKSTTPKAVREGPPPKNPTPPGKAKPRPVQPDS